MRRCASIARPDLRRPPRRRAREPCAPPAVGGVQAHRPAALTSPSRSTVLGTLRSCLAGLALHAHRRAAGHRRTLASAMASLSVDATPRPTQYQRQHSEARRANGRRESPVGRASNPRRIGQARARRLGTDRLTALTAAPPSALTDMADLPDESSDIPGVAGLFHRSDGHRTRAVRARAAGPSPSAHRPSPHHGRDRVPGSRRPSPSIRTTGRLTDPRWRRLFHATVVDLSATRVNTAVRTEILHFPARVVVTSARTLPIVLKKLRGVRKRPMIVSMPTTARPSSATTTAFGISSNAPRT